MEKRLNAVEAARDTMLSTACITLVGIMQCALCVSRGMVGYAVAAAFCVGIHTMLLISRVERYLELRYQALKREADEIERQLRDRRG